MSLENSAVGKTFSIYINYALALVTFFLWAIPVLANKRCYAYAKVQNLRSWIFPENLCSWESEKSLRCTISHHNNFVNQNITKFY